MTLFSEIAIINLSLIKYLFTGRRPALFRTEAERRRASTPGMRKSLVGPILTVIGVVLVAALFIYFYISLNRLEARVTAAQTEISTDYNKIQAIVSFINNSQTNAPTTQR